LEDIVSCALAAGATWFWFRDRDLERAERWQLAFRLADIVHDAGGRLSIGGDIELAAETGSGAVHMRDVTGIVHARKALGPSALAGLSAHSIADVTGAKMAGADYVTLSPIHPTASKPDYGPALGLTAITRGAHTGIPVLALGGITASNAAAAREAGAAGVAVMGGVMRVDWPEPMIKSLLAALASSHARTCR
jgi:thiamine-phosphate pyrophosphorylase